MRNDRIFFWLATSVIIIGEGAGNIATFNREYAKQIVYDLGYPEYFRVVMSAFKLIGLMILIVPKIPAWIKEWAYAGFFINPLRICELLVGEGYRRRPCISCVCYGLSARVSPLPSETC